MLYSFTYESPDFNEFDFFEDEEPFEDFEQFTDDDESLLQPEEIN